MHAQLIYSLNGSCTTCSHYINEWVIPKPNNYYKIKHDHNKNANKEQSVATHFPPFPRSKDKGVLCEIIRANNSRRKENRE